MAQFSAGVEALEQQLVVMGIRSSAKLDPSSNIIRVLIEMYVEIGDHIALQYGGSEAHKKVNVERASESSFHGPIGKVRGASAVQRSMCWTRRLTPCFPLLATHQHKELLTSIRRYYSNAFTDRLKQDAMNLFLGYYLPYRHTIPLWEMETDYYLHNLHVRAGRGTHHTMETYQRAFGVDWKEEDATPLNSPVPRMKKQSGSGETSDPDRTGSSLEKYSDTEAWRIARVRQRCNAQNEALSLWWKAAIQGYIQQRMWIQLGRNMPESMLPPRFERIYQPDRLAHFDRIFARSWATPVRSSHSSQHSTSIEEDSEIMEYRKNISGRGISAQRPERLKLHASSPSAQESDEATEDAMTIQMFVDTCGLKPRVAPTLTRFIKPHESRRSRSPARMGK